MIARPGTEPPSKTTLFPGPPKVGIEPKWDTNSKASPSTRCTITSSALHMRAAFSAIVSITDWRSPGELAITRRISLVAPCCSTPSRIPRACAAILFFNFATESPEDEERRFVVDFFEAFLFIRAKQKARLANPVRAHATHIQGATVIDQSANSIR